MKTTKFYPYKIILFGALFLCISQNLFSQTEVEEKFIQFSGVTVDHIDFLPVPFVIVYEKKSRRGTISDSYGFFSFVAEPGDTIVFKSLGYKKSTYVIPDSLNESNYSMIHQMTEDTVVLRTHQVYPWPSKEQFKEAFVAMDIPNDDLQRAEKNLSEEALALKAEAYQVSGSTTFKMTMQNYQTRLYYNGQTPPNNLLNPLAWAKFIQAWRNGDFKRNRTREIEKPIDY